MPLISTWLGTQINGTHFRLELQPLTPAIVYTHPGGNFLSLLIEALRMKTWVHWEHQLFHHLRHCYDLHGHTICSNIRSPLLLLDRLSSIFSCKSTYTTQIADDWPKWVNYNIRFCEILACTSNIRARDFLLTKSLPSVIITSAAWPKHDSLC